MKDTDFISSKEIQIRDVAKYFGIKESFMVSGCVYKNNRKAKEEYYKTLIEPYFKLK